MDNKREKESDLIVIASAEEFAYKHEMKVNEVLHLFQEKGIFELLRSQYEVFHTLDLSEGAEFVESYLRRRAT